MGTNDKTVAKEPQSSHYVSMANGRIYPAMRAASAGYEDVHPDEWRPATPTEIRSFKNGVLDTDTRKVATLSETVALPASPGSIRLADDDDDGAVKTDPETPVVPAPLSIPPAPAPALSALGGAPTPAFGDDSKSE
jgi:hypothetical protein